MLKGAEIPPTSVLIFQNTDVPFRPVRSNPELEIEKAQLWNMITTIG